MVKKKQKTKSIRPGKDIVASKAESLNKKLYKTLEQGITELTLDFVNVKSVDPVGLSVIAAVHNSMNSAGAKLMLKNVPSEIDNLFGKLGLRQHFDINQMG